MEVVENGVDTRRWSLVPKRSQCGDLGGLGMPGGHASRTGLFGLTEITAPGRHWATIPL